MSIRAWNQPWKTCWLLCEPSMSCKTLPSGRGTGNSLWTPQGFEKIFAIWFYWVPVLWMHASTLQVPLTQLSWCEIRSQPYHRMYCFPSTGQVCHGTRHHLGGPVGITASSCRGWGQKHSGQGCERNGNREGGRLVYSWISHLDISIKVSFLTVLTREEKVDDLNSSLKFTF